RRPPPYQATFSRVRGAVATTCRGASSLAPLTRGRPLPVSAGGGSYRLAAEGNLLTTCRPVSVRGASAPLSWLPWVRAAAEPKGRSGNQRKSTRSSTGSSWAGVRWGRPRLRLSAGERYRATSTGRAQGRLAKGKRTNTARTTHLWPQRQAV